METLLSRNPAASVPTDSQPLYNPLKDAVYIAGLVLIGLSFGLFELPMMASFEVNRGDFFEVFVIHYLLAFGYATTLFFAKRFRLKGEEFRENIGVILLWLVLSFISCYALNRELTVFQESTPWLAGDIVVACSAFIGFGFRNYFSRKGQLLLYALLGVVSVLFLYLAVYLLPMYGYGVIGGLALGLGFHVFVPLVSLIYLVRLLVRTYQTDKEKFQCAIAGALLPVLLMIPLLTYWSNAQKKITQAYNHAELESDNQLPGWVRVSQQLSTGWLTERILKTDLVYETPNKNGWFSWDMPGNRSFDEKRQHDPLVMIATALYGQTPLTWEEKIKILEADYDSRHQAQERLWSGVDLRTANVATNVRLFPESRIAYTEQTMHVRNMLKVGWRQEQEAIYTFHLPEGAVVSSLSLWINGKEEKGYLTTKGKAEKAYRTIVGVEMHDPSVVHWQEGNEVTVRVFPCSPDEDRRCKIGITSPLRIEGDQLVYTSIPFDGPEASGATQSTRIQVNGNSVGLDLPSSFTNIEQGVYTREGEYQSDWAIHFKAPDVRSQTFSFDGKTYQTELFVPAYAPFNAQKVYLDLNDSWTNNEMEKVWDLLKTKRVYVFHGKLLRLTEQNKEELFDRLGELRFSLFPLNEIKEPTTSLLISKSTVSAPNLKDLKESEFSKALMPYLSQKPQIRLYNLGTELSPYLQTLKEFRVLEYDQGDVSKLDDLLSKRQFGQTPEDDHTVVLKESGLRIRQTETASLGNAPDHLLRLFAYNDILRNIGQDYFKADYVNDELVKKAEQANVVSPVSSLIVLESEEDYKRFDITKSQNSLGNATAKSSGAVPEPHEWLLIALMAIIGGYLLVKTYG
jgi:XrtN system VIT domain protein